MKQWLLNKVRRFIGLSQAEYRLSTSISNIYAQLMFEQRSGWMKDRILYSTKPGVTSQRYTDHDVIVSLTSYSKRFYEVALAIESIMDQTMQANRIILWLSEDDYKCIPLSLRKLQERGLEIRMCEDYKSYKKLIPALQEFPKDTIITIDDDVIYDYDLLERLISASINVPNQIHACRVHRMTFGDNGRLNPYNHWNWEYDKPGAHRFNFATGVGGVLYPPGVLDDEVLNTDAFQSLCPSADDVWFKAMALKKGTLINKVATHNLRGRDYLENQEIQWTGLFHTNVLGAHANDTQIHVVFEKYDLFDNLYNQ